MSKKEKILLLDANALIHRSYHALPPLMTPKGEQVNAVYGFATALLKAIKDEKPDYVVACFDAGRETFRHEIFKEYKEHRKQMDDGLATQFPRVKQIVEVLNIPLYAQKGIEADDLIGSLTKIAAARGLCSVIVTGDNDALQLVNDDTCVYSLRRGVTDTLTYDEAAVHSKLGIYPRQVVDYKALAGDSSDNIPGAPGIGPKTAVELLNKYDNLEGIYQHLDELKERTAKILSENKDQVMVSRQIAAIKTDLEIDLDLQEAAVQNFDFSRVAGLFAELDFKSLLAKLPEPNLRQAALKEVVATEPIAQLPCELINDEARLSEIAEILAGHEAIVFDTETTTLDGELVGISLSWGADSAAFVATNPAHPDGMDLEVVRRYLAPVLEDPTIKKIGHNLKYDIAALRRVGIRVRGAWFDTMIASQLINSQLYAHDMDSLALTDLGFRKIPLTELIGPKKKESMATVPLDRLAAYSCEDALITWRLYEKYWKNLESPSLKRIFYEIEMPLLPILEEMEAVGIRLDKEYLGRLAVELKTKLDEIVKEIHRLSGSEFNIASPIQLQKVLFETLNLPVKGIKKTKSGYSTDADSLQKLMGQHPIIELLVAHRELSKLLSTYIDTLPELVDQAGRVHTSFQQIGAATGRLSSTNPNLQNIPIRTELGNKVRRAFVADQGRLLMGVDYSQAELRILAHLSQDPGLIEAFKQGNDFHGAVANQLGVDRRAAKAINFGIIYGLGAHALAFDLNIPVGEAKEFIDRYFTTFPGVARFIDAMKTKARQDGYTETIYGRRRYVPDIDSPNPMLRSTAERVAVNLPCQGSVADLMKLSMVKVATELPEGAQMLLQIHDELLFEVEEGVVAETAATVCRVMESIASLAVPLEVEVKVGSNWADLKPLG